MAKKPTTKQARVRKLLEQVPASASDFDALCMDFFPDTYRRFGNGMDRVAKISLIFTVENEAEINEVLNDKFPMQYKEFCTDPITTLGPGEDTDLPRGGSISLAVFTVFLLVVPFLAIIILCWPVFSVSKFRNDQIGVVVAYKLWNGLATLTQSKAICQLLAKASSENTVCIPTSALEKPERITQEASLSRAVLLVVINDNDTASVHPLLSNAKLKLPFSTLPPLPISTQSEQEAAAEVIETMRRILGDRLDLCLDHLPSSPGSLPEYRLLALIFQSACPDSQPFATDGMSSGRNLLLEQLNSLLCQNGNQDAQTCLWVKYLQAQYCPMDLVAGCEDSIQTLRSVSRSAPKERVGILASIELARRVCSTKPEEAGALILSIGKQESQEPCLTARFLPMIECSLASSSAEEEGISQWRIRLYKMRASLLELRRRCPASSWASILGERGHQQLRSGNMQGALVAFEEAYRNDSRNTEYALDRAETWLLNGYPERVPNLIVLHRVRPWLRTHATFLLWLASSARQDAQNLLDEYVEHAIERPAIYDSAKTIRQITCTKPGPTCSIFELLLAPKTKHAQVTLKSYLDSFYPGQPPLILK